MSILGAAFFRDEEAAYSKLESVLWPAGTQCPHCGVVGSGVKIKANPERKVRHGLWKCADCKKQFTVTVGTIFESSPIPLHKRLQAAYLLNAAQEGISAKQIERTLQITYKSAWFMTHRLREAIAPAGEPPPRGGEGRTIEVDEPFIYNVGWVANASECLFHDFEAPKTEAEPIQSFYCDGEETGLW